MVSKQDIFDYGFDNIEDYFDYILQSRVNGQHKQARELFSKLSDGMQGQKAQFFNYIEATYYYDAMDADAMDELNSLRDYFKPSNQNHGH